MSVGESPKLVCLGNLTIDDVFLSDGTRRLGCIGGDALYAALAARLWEPTTQMVAPVGNDLPEEAMAQILRAGLHPDGLPRRSIRTIHNQVFYDSEGGRRWKLLTSDEDFHTLSPRPIDIPPAYRNAAAFLVLAMSLAAQEELVHWLRAHTAALIALDLQEDYIIGNESRLQALISQVDVIMPSEEEARQLLHHQDWIRAVAEFAAWGPRVVVIKRGSAGSLVYGAQSGVVLEVPAFPTRAVDTTGAGDAYCGGFLAALLQEGRGLEYAACVGAISASFAIASFGTRALVEAAPADASMRLVQWQESGPIVKKYLPESMVHRRVSES